MKIEAKAIGDIAQATPQAGGDMAWFDKAKDIIDGVNQLLVQYQRLRNSTANTEASPNPSKEWQSRPPKEITSGGSDIMNKLLDFAIQFCDNLEKQGFGEQPIGKVISEIPMSVNSVITLLKAIRLKQGWSKK